MANSFSPKMYLIVVQRDENKRKCLPNWNRCLAQQRNTHTYTPKLAQSGPFINHFWHISDSFSSSSSRFVCCALWPLGALHANCLPTQKTVQIFVVSGLVVVALDVVIAERCHAWLVIQKLMLSWSRKAEKICNDNLKQTLTCLAYTL